MLMHVSDCSKTQKIGDKAIEKNLKKLKPIHVPDQHKTQQTCEKVF